MESLRSLGYLASDDNAPADSAKKAAIDPKDKIEIANALHRALVDIEEDQYDDAIARTPGDGPQGARHGDVVIWNWAARWFISAAIRRRYRSCVRRRRRTPDSGMAHYELALALIKTGQWEDCSYPK